MASQWFCKLLGREMGPLTFQELVEMVRAGTLTEDDPVRRQGSSEWSAAREVIGLFRAAGKQAEQEAAPPASQVQPEPTPAPSQPERAERPAWKVPRIGKRGLILAGGVLVVIVVAVVCGWWASTTPRFPHPLLDDPQHARKTVLDAVRAPRPETPSVPGLPERVPRPVPGLEGRRYGANAGLCFEAQNWPNAVNQPGFPDVIVRPGDCLVQETHFSFYSP